MPGFGSETALFELGRERRQPLAQIRRQAGIGSAYRDMDFPAALRQPHCRPPRSGVEVERNVVRDLLGGG